MPDQELSAREIALRERQLDLEERKLKAGLIDWVKGLGLPIASLVASVAVFLVQMQQQSFERSLNSVREGYKMYFDNISKIDLKTDDDFYRAKRVLETTAKIYPEVFCGARDDLVTRIMSAPMESDRLQLTNEVNTLTPGDLQTQVQMPKWIKLDWLEPRTPSCTVTAKATPMAPTESPAASPPSTSIAASAARGDSAPPAAGLAAPAPAAAPPAAEASRVQAQQVTPTRAYQVFVQIGPTRDRAQLDAIRDEAAGLGFRMAAGVEKIRRPITRAEIRYFGDDQDRDAQALADFMNAKFAAEGINFTPNPIGRAYPNLPKDTMEVWVPDSAKVAIDALKGRIRQVGPVLGSSVP
jgi:hypothetical protein